MRGWNVFEGIRAYRSVDGDNMFIFRNDQHMDRLFNQSMKILRMKAPYSPAEITAAMVALLRANRYEKDVHIRPTVYFGVAEDFESERVDIDTGCYITARERPGKSTLRTGISACVSSWRRIDDTDLPPRVKAGANYLNSRYVNMEARMNGYQSAIILNHAGKVAEGPGECVMIVRKDVVITPPVTAGILESITRATLIQLFREELGVEVVERDVDRTELYIADEVFFCGTGAEVQPVTSVDRYPIGDGEPGPLVKRMHDLYFPIARGNNSKYEKWLTPVFD